MLVSAVKKLIDKAAVVSFDIFGTLIIRSYDKPVDVFKHIEISKKISDFSTKRQKAEQDARIKNSKNNIEEVTIDEIYALLPAKWQDIKLLELKQEMLCCSCDLRMYELFEYAKKQNKRIVITSDMYLPKKTVEQILKNAGYAGYEKLLLSSEQKHTKASGTLFEDLIDYVKVPAEQILHIGDNLLTDNDIPENMGIKTWHYLKAVDMDGYANELLFLRGLDSKINNSLPLSVLKGLLVKRKQQSSGEFWADFGYQYAGLLTVAFCQWLKSCFDRDKITQAFFMSRDGYIVKKVFDCLYPNFPTQYLLQGAADEENQISLKYLDEIGLNSGRPALVGIERCAFVQKLIERSYGKAKRKSDVYEYYLATYPHEDESSKITSFAADKVNPDDWKRIVGPNLGLLKLIYAAEELRISVSDKICDGVVAFVKDWQQLTQNFSVEIDAESALLPLSNFEINASAQTLEHLRQIYCSEENDASEQIFTKSPRYNPQKTLGMIYTFPGCSSAEKELAFRFKKAGANLGYEIVLIDNNGYILDKDTNRTEQKLKDEDVKFIISEHFIDYKILDSFYYHTLWNPPEIVLTTADSYTSWQKNIMSMDDFLIYDDGGMSEHLKSMLIDEPRNLEHASCLLGSFPKSEMKQPNLENPKLFYCGMNWEYYFGGARHAGLFRLLDNGDLIRIYGPKKLPGLQTAPWSGYKNYMGEIPFDGFSILDEINKCGVVLAVSSDAHRRAGAVTNRVYEGCAAGAVIISDDNRFMQKHFGDTVLYINLNKNNPLDTYRQIAQKLEWIKNHKQEALNLAKASQKIFAEKFCMEVQLQNVLERHESRKSAVADALYARKNEETVMAVAYFDNLFFTADERYRLQHILDQIAKQKYANTKLVLACNEDFADEVQDAVPTEMKNVTVVPFAMFNAKHSKVITRGQMLRRITSEFEHAYLVLLQGGEILFSDHFSILKRKLEDDSQAIAAHAGAFLDSRDSFRYPQVRSLLTYPMIYNCKHNPDGMCMLKSEIEALLPSFADTSLDGYELFAYLNRAVFTHKRSLIYSNHITCGINENISLRYTSPILSAAMQTAFVQGLVAQVYDQWLHEHNTNSLAQSGLMKPVDAKVMKKMKKILRFAYAVEIIFLKIARCFVFGKTVTNKIKQKIKNEKSKRKELNK